MAQFVQTMQGESSYSRFHWENKSEVTLLNAVIIREIKIAKDFLAKKSVCGGDRL